MDFYFPRTGIFLTTIPKTGCTSVMTYFTAIETFLEENGLTSFPPEGRIDFFLDFEIYKNIHFDGSKANKFRVCNNYKLENDEIISIATYRNPFERFGSFWFDKVVRMGDFNYFNFAQNELSTLQVLDSNLIRSAAKKFISRNINSSGIVDQHFNQQHVSIRQDLAYDFYIETKDLKSLPGMLSQKNSVFECLRKVEFIQLNKTPFSVMAGFYDRELVELVATYYSKDLEILKNLGFAGKITPPISFRDFSSIEIDEIKDVRRINIIGHLTAERDAVTAERDAITSSTSWKLTYPYRRIRQINNSFWLYNNDSN
jgi:hypothetical protein